MSQKSKLLASASPGLVVSVAAGVSVLIVVLERSTGMSDILWVLHLLPIMVVVWRRDLAAGTLLGAMVLLLGMSDWSADGRMAFVPGDPAELALKAGIVFIFGVLTKLVRGSLVDSETDVKLDLASGLTSGGAFSELLSHEVERALRYGRSFTLVYVRIENIGAAHQRAGRAATEESLSRIGYQIKGTLRSGDIVARRGEQEFALLLPETGEEAARTVLQRIQRRLNDGIADEATYLSFAIGAVTWVRCSVSAEQLQQFTYQSLHKARLEGSVLNHEVLWEPAADSVDRPLSVAV